MSLKNREDTATIANQNPISTKFESTMHCSRFPFTLFGLPFDAVSLAETKKLIRTAISTREQLLIATPNVNFVGLASKDNDFYQSILNCDLSVVDGTPIFWLLRMLNAPLPEKVQGSSLIESIIADTSAPPIKAFFFGGLDDIAAQASAVLNKTAGGMISVGSHNPGFGSIEDMSSDSIIDCINDANPDFLIVSLGAQKGHKWIEHNRNKLKVPVISHLGAVVNFVAGTKKRSPPLLQTLALEWIWRIYQEPTLYRRYANDALILAKLLVKHFLPILFHHIRHRLHKQQAGSVNMTSNGPHINYVLTGQFGTEQCTELLNSLRKTTITKETILHFDMGQTSYLDSQLAGAILRLQTVCAQNSAEFAITSIAPIAKKMLHHFMINTSDAPAQPFVLR